MALSRVPFGGLGAREADELVPLDRALAASDCVLDDDTITGRHGYKCATAAAIGTEGGVLQGLWRYRSGPASSEGHTVACVGGKVIEVVDPSSETAYGAANTIDTIAAWATANISAAELNDMLYLASDVDNDPWRRLKPGVPPTIESILALPTGALPTQGTRSSMSIVKFSNASAVTLTDDSGVRQNSRTAASETVYYYDSDSGGNIPAGSWIKAELALSGGVAQVWTGYTHMILLAAPNTKAKGGSQWEVSIGDDTGTPVYSSIATIYDSGYTPGLAPGVWYLSLENVPADIMAGVKWIRFTAKTPGVIQIQSYVLVKQAPGAGDFEYRTTFYDSSTTQESKPTETLKVNIPAPTLDTFPSTVLTTLDSDNNLRYHDPTSLDPRTLHPGQNGNTSAQIPMPPIDVFAGAPTITQAIPSAIQTSGKLRVWRMTSAGWRMVEEKSWTSASSVSVVDYYRDKALAAAKWKATGSPPRCNAMAAVPGRLVSAYQNRVHISSFLSPATTSNPYPQFPSVNESDADGWAFDVAPSTREQVQGLAWLDALYILTNEAVYALPDVTPGGRVYEVIRRGCMGRRAFCVAEKRLYWASWDGVYEAQNDSQSVLQWRGVEMTEDVRRYYQDTFAATSATVVTYQARKLYLFCATRYMRYDFVTGRWTTGTVADTFSHAAQWHDPGGTVDRLWLLAATRKPMRWHTTHTTDDGTAIPSWAFSTGYAYPGVSSRVMRLLADVSAGSVTVSLKPDASSDDRDVTVTTPGTGKPVEIPGASDLRSYRWRIALAGVRAARIRSLWWDLEPLDARGG